MKKNSNAPDKIYLQWDEHPNAEVTWCVDQVADGYHAVDIEYTRVPTWVSVKDGLPRESEWVVICDERDIWNKGQYVEGTWWKYPGRNKITVTHWMPILFMPEGRTPPIVFTEEELLRGLE